MGASQLPSGSFNYTSQDLNENRSSLRAFINEHHQQQEIEEYKIQINHQKDWQLAQQILSLRKQSLYLVKVFHFSLPETSAQPSRKKAEGFVYLQRIFIRLTQLGFLDLLSQIHLLAHCILGFEKLYQYFGPFQVHSDCIGANKQKVIKVWHNPNFSVLYPAKKLSSQSEMVSSMIETICFRINNRRNEKSFKDFLLERVHQSNFEELKRIFYEYLIKLCNKIPTNLSGWEQKTQQSQLWMENKKKYKNCMENSNENKNYVDRKMGNKQGNKPHNISKINITYNSISIQSMKKTQSSQNTIDYVSQNKKFHHFRQIFSTHQLANNNIKTEKLKICPFHNKIYFSFLKPLQAHNSNQYRFIPDIKYQQHPKILQKEKHFDNISPFSIKKNSFFIRNELSNIFDNVRDTESIVNQSIRMRNFDEESQLQSYPSSQTETQNSQIQFLKLVEGDEIIEDLSSEFCEKNAPQKQSSIVYLDFLQKLKIRQTKVHEFDQDGHSENEEIGETEMNLEYSSQYNEKDQFKSLRNIQHCNHQLGSEWTPCQKNSISSKLINIDLSSNQKSVNSYQNNGSKVHIQFQNQKSSLYIHHPLLDKSIQFEVLN